MQKRFFNPGSVSICAQISQPDWNTGKPLLVFLHYWGGTSSTWHKLTTPTSPTSLSLLFPIIALDLRGWGDSAHPQETVGGPSVYSVQAMALDVASVLSQLEQDENDRSLLGNGIVLVGHSMGAKVALASLASMADTIFPQVKGLVLVAPAPPTSLDLPSEMKAQQQVAYESAESVRWTVENVLANTKRLDPSDVDLVIRGSLGGSSCAKKAWPSYGMQEDVSPALHRLLSSSRVPIKASVLVGELDVVEPQERVQTQVVEFLQRHEIQVSMRVLPGVKHLIPLEDPGAIFQEICHL